ncbi:aminotransferase family protein [Diplonema papillatum]|nr:aminotransferase family protein [Diplonema papillatum]|eukprot:gene6113-9387_t
MGDTGLFGEDLYDPSQHVCSAGEQWAGWSESDDEQEQFTVDFANGQPHSDEMPKKEVLDATMSVLSTAHSQLVASVNSTHGKNSAEQPSPLQYGRNKGDFWVRRELSDFLTRHGTPSVKPDELLITAGSSQALDACCAAWAVKEDRPVVFVETPTYFLAAQTFRTHRMKIVGVECDGDGPVVEDVRAKAKTHGVPCFFYVIPMHHNPTGRTTSPERAERLCDLAIELGMRIVADEVYQQLSWKKDAAAPVESLRTVYLRQAKQARPGGPAKTPCDVVSISSVTKILSPGLRVGWAHAGRSTIQQLATYGVIESGGGQSHFTSHIAAHAMHTKALDAVISTLNARYEERAEALYASLHHRLCTHGVYISQPDGGYFIWCVLPPGRTTKQLVQRLESMHAAGSATRVLIKEGSCFYLADDESDRGEADRSFRLCFAKYPTAALRRGGMALGDAIIDLLKDKAGAPAPGA